MEQTLRLSTTISLVLLFSCGPDEPIDPVPAHAQCWEGYADPAAAIGSVEPGPALAAQEEFQPFADPATVQIFKGIQGGHHVFLSASISVLNPGDPAAVDPKAVNPRTLFNLYRATGEKVNLNACPATRAYQLGDDSRYELGARQVILDEKLIPAVYEEELRLVAEVLDCDGLYAYDERWVTVLTPVE